MKLMMNLNNFVIEKILKIFQDIIESLMTH